MIDVFDLHEDLSYLKSDKEKFEYFMNYSKLNLDKESNASILSYMYVIWNEDLFKNNIMLISKAFGDESFVQFAISLFMLNAQHDRDFIIRVILAKLCNVLLDLPIINLRNKKELDPDEEIRLKFAQTLAYLFYDNGKRSYYDICTMYNNLVSRKKIDDYRQIITQKKLINLDNAIIEKIFKLNKVENIFVTPLTTNYI